MAYPVPVPGVIHKCYRGSASESALVAAMLTYHRARKTWQREVDCYIVLSEFAHRKFVEGGLPEERIFVKPNFVSRIPTSKARTTSGDYALFVGRLSPEKGLDKLLSAWQALPQVPLKIMGDGPLRHQTDSFANRYPYVSVFGHVDRDMVLNSMLDARFLVFTSSWYEGFPMAIAEAFSCGLPVIAPRLGGIPEIVRNGVTGLLYTPGDTADLTATSEWLWNHPEESERMGRAARWDYEHYYTPERNYEMLIDIYQFALNNRRE